VIQGVARTQADSLPKDAKENGQKQLAARKVATDDNKAWPLAFDMTCQAKKAQRTCFAKSGTGITAGRKMIPTRGKSKLRILHTPFWGGRGVNHF